MFECFFCNKENKNNRSLKAHQRLCNKNPQKQESNFKFVKAPWNKGLDKGDPRVARNAQNVSDATKGKPSKTIWTEEMKKAKSEWRKQFHKDHPEMHPNRRLANNRKKWTYPEQIAANWLDKHNISYEYNKKIGDYYPDFLIDNIIIEIDGEYWHDKIKDYKRDNILSSMGFLVFRIKTKENIEERLQKILDVAQRKSASFGN